ncbi:unnamed protein product [Clonostachys rosea]|uniref:Glycoside hydrolase family 43 protein n=1 Tax=Bionectria ochroleuca TaxID=29856 RepID=A0ABY6UTK7_BIOOC|nr:unnamed protein product [Clonostachys rosea]
MRLVLFINFALSAWCQDDLGYGNGFLNASTAKFSSRLVRDAQTLASLKAVGESFDFAPADFVKVRSRNGQYHWGDITYRYREVFSVDWIEGDSAQSRHPVLALPTSDGVLAAADLSPTLPKGPLQITREWLDADGDLGLRFSIKNTGNTSIEIGSLGLPAAFDNIFTGRSPDAVQQHCSLSQPYIGLDAGHIRVNPVRGIGSALVVTPLNGTHSPMEAYRFLPEKSYSETNYQSHSYEGNYEWQILTKAWAENEWVQQDPWNTPTSRTLKIGELMQIGVRFTTSTDGVRGFDNAVLNTGTPVAVGVPGYILPRDLPGQLLLRSRVGVVSLTAEPPGSLEIKADGTSRYTLTPSPKAWGRVRVLVEYEDGKQQAVHYYITKSAPEAIADVGNFLTTKAYFNDSSDPFGRSPSVLNYDNEQGALMQQHTRVFIAGLSNEAGSGAYLAAFLKQLLRPDVEELRRLNAFVDDVLWGKLQLEDYSVRKSLFYYEPAKVPNFEYQDGNWSQRHAWNQEKAYLVNRAYDYVHPTGAYWTLYRIARAFPEIVTHSWEWYLEKAFRTALRSLGDDVLYGELGLMGETVWGEILADLGREGRTEWAGEFEDAMKARADHWNQVSYPFGSEAPWDSTGQEGVYYWASHFGLKDLAEKAVNSVLGFTPNVPHWGWNGNAHRYWDFSIAGKIQTIERQIHHYASSLNSLVLLSAYRENSTDTYLLRAGHGASFGSLSNIHQDGFPSAAFHSFPNLLKWDAYVSDYGQGFLGMALASGTYVAVDDDLGLVAYGGVLLKNHGSVTVLPRDPSRKRIFIGPLKVMITIEVGQIESLSYQEQTKSIKVRVSQWKGGPLANSTVLWLESGSDESWKVFAGESIAAVGRGGWLIPLKSDGFDLVSVTW